MATHIHLRNSADVREYTVAFRSIREEDGGVGGGLFAPVAIHYKFLAFGSRD